MYKPILQNSIATILAVTSVTLVLIILQVKPFEIYAKELTIVGSYAGSYETWPAAIALISSGAFDPSLIIDTETELSEINNMLSKLDNDKSIVKAQIKIS